MHRIRPTNISSTLLLFVLTLHMLTYSLVLPTFELNSLQDALSEQVVCTSSLATISSGEQPLEDDFKPPKHSYIDYSAFLAPNFILNAYNPSVSRLLFYEPFQAPPQVFLEIVVPPHPA